jgi:hypothetical protein
MAGNGFRDELEQYRPGTRGDMVWLVKYQTLAGIGVVPALGDHPLSPVAALVMARLISVGEEELYLPGKHFDIGLKVAGGPSKGKQFERAHGNAKDVVVRIESFRIVLHHPKLQVGEGRIMLRCVAPAHLSP